MARGRTLTEQLRKAIYSSGMTRYRIAKQLGIHQSTLDRFMHGQRGLKMSVLDQLVALLDLELKPRARARKGR